MKPRVEAWAVVDMDTGRLVFVGSEKAQSEYWAARGRLVEKARVAHLIEADTSAAAELKALRRVAKAAVKWQSMVLKEGERATVTSALAYCAQLKRLHDAVLALSQRKGRKP